MPAAADEGQGTKATPGKDGTEEGKEPGRQRQRTDKQAEGRRVRGTRREETGRKQAKQ